MIRKFNLLGMEVKALILSEREKELLLLPPHYLSAEEVDEVNRELERRFNRDLRDWSICVVYPYNKARKVVLSLFEIIERQEIKLRKKRIKWANKEWL